VRSMCLLHTSVTWQTDAKGNGEANAKEAGGCQKHRYLPIYFADYEAVVKLADGFNAADLRNVCTEAGMFAIRAERDYVVEEDFMKAVRKVAENKKLEGKLEYSKV